jgi:hypothetical protein
MLARMDDVVRELKAFVAALKKRPDVVVEAAAVGKKASRSELEHAADLPEELRALYAAMNGAHVEWRFVEPGGGGCLRVPPLSEWTRFQCDDATYMGFGEDFEALFFDEITPEGSTWIVRRRGTGEHRLVFAPAGRASEGIEPARSIAEYLRAGMRSGFGHWWPMCFRDRPHVSYAAQEEAIRRFQAPPVKPAAIRTGARVHFGYFAEGGRGEVRRVVEVSESEQTRFHGTRFAEVALDEGTIALLPVRFMKAHTKRDAYEALRASLPSEPWPARGPLEVLEELARAIGPLSHYGSAGPSNARLAAGVLSAHALDHAVDVLCALYDAAIAARLSFTERLPLEKTGRELSSSEWSRFRWQHAIGDTLEGLFAGLLLVLRHRSADASLPPGALVDPARVARLRRCGKARAIVEAVDAGTVLEKPAWHHAPTPAIGLPEGAILLSGTGF